MTGQPLPYVFIWSDNYKQFADCLRSSIQSYTPYLSDQSQYIPQSEFDKYVYKHNGHFLNGCFIKLEQTLSCLYSFPENSYFIFSDADILLFPNKQFERMIDFYRSMETDIVFMRESLTNDTSNIGFSLIRVNDHNRKLFQHALDLAKQDPTNLDQTIVNQALKHYTGSHAYFPCEFVMTSSTCMDYDNRCWLNYFTNIRPNCIVFQPLCDPTLSKEDVFQHKANQYKERNMPIPE